jgi:hypothetical protein
MSMCPADTRKAVHKNPSTSDTIRRFVEQQHKLAWDEARSKPDASPEKLVQLGGIKNIEKAYVVVRDLLIEQIFSNLLDVSMSEAQRTELFNSVVNSVESKIEELMQKPRHDLEETKAETTSQ